MVGFSETGKAGGHDSHSPDFASLERKPGGLNQAIGDVCKFKRTAMRKYRKYSLQELLAFIKARLPADKQPSHLLDGQRECAEPHAVRIQCIAILAQEDRLMTFPLMDLPPELRIMIYEKVFRRRRDIINFLCTGTRIYNDAVEYLYDIETISMRFWMTPRRGTLAPTLDIDVTVGERSSATRFIYAGHRHFNFQDGCGTPDMEAFARYIAPFKRVQKPQLHFIIDDFFGRVGERPSSPSKESKKLRCDARLRTFREIVRRFLTNGVKLQSLELKFVTDVPIRTPFAPMRPHVSTDEINGVANALEDVRKFSNKVSIHFGDQQLEESDSQAFEKALESTNWVKHFRYMYEL